jgi:hypothetical protein
MIVPVIMNLLQILESSGAEVLGVDHDVDHTDDTGTRWTHAAVIRIRIDDREERLIVETRQRAPYRGELTNLPSWGGTEPRGIRVLVAPFVSESLGQALVAAGWSWADHNGNCDIRSRGLRLARRTANRPERPATRSLPGGRGGLTMIRWLTSEAKEPVGATKLARIAGVSQPRASQCLAELGHLGLVHRVHRSGWLPDGPGLWKAFLESYAGPKGTEQYFYSLDPPLQTAVSAIRSQPQGGQIALSADVGPDLLAPSRAATHLVIYCAGVPGHLGDLWQQAESRVDANVILRAPQDSSFLCFDFSVVVWDTKLPLVHPTQMAWDLYDLGGEDRMEQAHELEEWTHEYRERV